MIGKSPVFPGLKIKDVHMDKFVSVLDSILAFANRISALCIFGMAALVLAEIFARSALDYSIKLVWETGSYLLAASWFLAAGFTLRTGGHVRISILTNKLPAAAARIVDIIATMGGTIICSIVWAAILQLFIDSIKFNKASFTPMQTPLWIPQSFVVIGATLLLLTMIVRLCLLLLKKEPDLPFASDEL